MLLRNAELLLLHRADVFAHSPGRCLFRPNLHQGEPERGERSFPQVCPCASPTARLEGSGESGILGITRRHSHLVTAEFPTPAACLAHTRCD